MAAGVGACGLLQSGVTGRGWEEIDVVVGTTDFFGGAGEGRIQDNGTLGYGVWVARISDDSESRGFPPSCVS